MKAETQKKYEGKGAVDLQGLIKARVSRSITLQNNISPFFFYWEHQPGLRMTFMGYIITIRSIVQSFCLVMSKD